MTEENFDVVITGSGISGCTLALVLARQGVRTLVLDRATHPRFALGESLLKPTVLWFRVLAERFGVPELGVIANLNQIHDRIGATSGVKKSFGFVRHAPHVHATVAQWWANIAVSYAEDVLEAHLFRQDIDAWLYAQAAAAGCVTRVGVIEEDLSRDDGPLRLLTSQGIVRCEFLVDCAGQAMHLPRLASLQESPTRLRTNSRTLYTHMIGVRPFDACDAAPAPALPWHQGTLHHLLDGAWMWVIPFDNHPHSVNPLVSVGVNFDNLAHPAERAPPPAEEWRLLLQRYPALAAQFKDARPVRPWIATGRLQGAASQFVGARCAVLGQAAGNVDALFSRGLLNTVQSLHLLAELLLDALRTQDFAIGRFAPLERLQHNLFAVHDALVRGSYVGFRAPALTDWWLALWSLVERLSLSQLVPSLAALEQGDEDAWQAARADLERGEAIIGQSAILQVLAAANDVMDSFAADRIDAEAALARLETLAAPLLPLGHDLNRFRQLTREHGFSPIARRLLETEHALTAAIEIIDRHAGLPMTLRRSSFINGIVRMLALRHARQAEVELAQPALGEALDAAIARVAIPGVDRGRLRALAASLSRISLRQTTGSPRESDLIAADRVTLLDCRADGRHVALHHGRDSVTLETEALGIRLQVTLEGCLPPEVLASLTSTPERSARPASGRR